MINTCFTWLSNFVDKMDGSNPAKPTKMSTLLDENERKCSDKIINDIIREQDECVHPTLLPNYYKTLERHVFLITVKQSASWVAKAALLQSAQAQVEQQLQCALTSCEDRLSDYKNLVEEKQKQKEDVEQLMKSISIFEKLKDRLLGSKEIIPYWLEAIRQLQERVTTLQKKREELLKTYEDTYPRRVAVTLANKDIKPFKEQILQYHNTLTDQFKLHTDYLVQTASPKLVEVMQSIAFDWPNLWVCLDWLEVPLDSQELVVRVSRKAKNYQLKEHVNYVTKGLIVLHENDVMNVSIPIHSQRPPVTFYFTKSVSIQNEQEDKAFGLDPPPVSQPNTPPSLTASVPKINRFVTEALRITNERLGREFINNGFDKLPSADKINKDSLDRNPATRAFILDKFGVDLANTSVENIPTPYGEHNAQLDREHVN